MSDDEDWYDEDPERCLVIDHGSYSVFSGFAGDDAPRSVLSSVLGHDTNTQQVHYGDYAFGGYQQFEYQTFDGVKKSVNEDELCMKPTIQYALDDNSSLAHGFIRTHASRRIPAEIIDLVLYHLPEGLMMDWQQLQILWQYIYKKELRVQPEEWSMVLSEPSLIPKHCRERTAEIFLETFNIPSLMFKNSAVLSLMASGSRTQTGIVCDIGHYKSDVTPVYEGYAMQSAVSRLEIGGKDISDYLASLLSEKLSESFAMDIVYGIKHKQSSSQITECILPDGRVIDAANEVRQSAEVLFTPNIIKKRGFRTYPKGIASLIEESVNRCDSDLKSELLNNIRLSGGSSMFDSIDERIQNEIFPDITAHWRFRKQVRVIAAPERKYLTWIGGSIAGSLPYDPTASWVTKEELTEYGSAIIHRKCF